MEGMLIKGVAKDADIATASVFSVPDKPGMSFKLFSLLAQKKINVDIWYRSSGRGDSRDIIFLVPLADADAALTTLEEYMPTIGGGQIVVDKDVAKVSVVGAGIQSHSGVAAKLFETLYEENINIRMISTSEIRISVIIAKEDADRAVNAVHDAFIH